MGRDVFLLPGLGADSPAKVSAYQAKVADGLSESRRRASLSAPVAPLRFTTGDYHAFLDEGHQYKWEKQAGKRLDSNAELIRSECECCKDGPGRKVRHRVIAKANGAPGVPKVMRRVIQDNEPTAVDFVMRPKYRAAIRDSIRSQTPENASVIIGHSLGTLVGLDLLANTDIQPNLFLTFGSPIGIKALYREFESSYWEWIKRRAVPWVNVHHRNDEVTGCGGLREDHFPRVVNIRVRHGGRAHSSIEYFSHPSVSALVDAATAGEGAIEPERVVRPYVNFL